MFNAGAPSVKMQTQPPLTLSLTFIFVLSFLMAAGLGYQGLNRFYAPDLNQLSDTYFYFYIVENGISETLADKAGRSTRFLMPMLGKLVLEITPALGSWDRTAFALLVVGAMFVAGICCQIYYIARRLQLDGAVAIGAVFIYLLNFQITNIFVVGLIDGAFAFFIMLYVIVSFERRYLWLPVVAILGVVTKEVFLPFVCAYSFILVAYDYWTKRTIEIQAIVSGVISAVICLLIFLYLRELSMGSVVTPLQHAEGLWPGNAPLFTNPLGTLMRFSYVFGWLLPLAVFSLGQIDPRLRTPLLLSLIPLLVLGTVAAISGNGYGRISFNVVGPVFAIAASLTTFRFFSQRS